MNNTEKEEMHKKFYELHKKLMNQVIEFCKENGIENVDTVNLYADRVMDSVGFGQWTAATDSCFSLIDENKNVIIESL